MFTQEESVEEHALAARGWSITLIARHPAATARRSDPHPIAARGRNPRSHRRSLAAFEPYLAQRFAGDPPVRAQAFMRERVPLGFTASYQTLTREIRARGLRPRCEACAGGTFSPRR